jgi:hypothetical protein
MRISQLKEQVKAILREKTMNEFEFNIGKQQYTKRGLTPTGIHSLTMDYVNLPVTRLQKKQDLMINAFMDMKNLLGVDYNYNTKKFSKSSKPALMVHLLKNTLVDKKEYIDIYKKLTDKITQLSKYVQNSTNRGNVGRSSGMAHTYAMRDMQNEGKEPEIIAQLRDVVKNGYKTLKDPKTGKNMKVDSYSASAITQVYDAINNPSTKDKFVKSGLLGMQSVSFKAIRK